MKATLQIGPKPKSSTPTTPSFTATRSGLLQRKCACGGTPGPSGECESCRRKRLQRQSRKGSPSPVSDQPALGSDVPAIVSEVLRSPGQPLDIAARGFMEPRFGHDFSQVRVHADARAAESARAVDAVAYTSGRHVVFANKPSDLNSVESQFLWAHELSHVIQQQDTERYSPLHGIAIQEDNRLEDEANRAARTITRNSTAFSGQSKAGRAVMRLTPADFRKQLGANANQKAATDSLYGNASFVALWNYMKSCKAAPTQDLGPLELKITPGLKIRGVERYGGYSPFSRTLEINPTKPEHAANPTELMDTVVHEFIHAVSDLEPECVKAGAKAAPLAGGATISPPALVDVKGTADEDKWLTEAGPGASNPCEEFIDINKAAQDMIVAILKENITKAKVGRPTITFVNDALRREPKALAEYKKCRDVACAHPAAAKRSKEIALCSEAILTKYVAVPAKPPPKKTKGP